MTVPFKQIPANIRVPLFYAELDNSQANSAVANQNTLIIGQIRASGTAVPNVPVLSQGVGDAAVVGGLNSMLHLMTNTYRQNDVSGQVYYLPLADDGAAVAATGTFTLTAAPTAAGVLSLYIAGILVQLPVSPTQTVTQIATALVALIGTTALMPVSASNAAGVVTLTALNLGLAGNDIDIRVNYLGSAAGEATPTGLTYTIVGMANGAVNPSLTTGLANLVSKSFDFIVCPYTDATSIASLKAFMNDVTGRWAWSQQIYGHVFMALRGTSGALTTFGASQNNQHQTVMGFNDSPSPSWLWAASVAGAVAVSLRNDPALPLQTVQFFGVLPPPVQSQFTLTINNNLLYTGISTFNVAADGSLSIQNLITSYLTNSFGAPDNSYLEVETMFTLMFVVRFLQNRVTTKFARQKLAANGTRFAAGASVVTPNIIKADQIAAFQELEFAGLVQNSAAFAATIIVEQDAVNKNRVNVLWGGTLIDQLRIFAMLIQFRL